MIPLPTGTFFIVRNGGFAWSTEATDCKVYSTRHSGKLISGHWEHSLRTTISWLGSHRRWSKQLSEPSKWWLARRMGALEGHFDEFKLCRCSDWFSTPRGHVAHSHQPMLPFKNWAQQAGGTQLLFWAALNSPSTLRAPQSCQCRHSPGETMTWPTRATSQSEK